MKNIERKMAQALAEATSTIKAQKRASGGKAALQKIVRTPNLTRPLTSSTRPSSERGVTFHFRHTVKSKRNDRTASPTDHTTAAIHQAYIERKSAVEVVDPSIMSLVAADVEGGAAGGAAPLHADQDRANFGVIGKTRPEREAFWRKVENAEGRVARVQSRIIAELPHEAGPRARITMVRDFCRSLDEHNLPWWAAIHKPTDKNDDRNYHVHITYFDRPARMDSDGAWDFEREETIRDEKGRTRRRRPEKQNKPAAVRARGWVKNLRAAFAEAANNSLAAEKIEKRYDPRPYRESGIEKHPTIHLGPKASALEDAGIDSHGGRVNAKREGKWRIDAVVKPWFREISWADSIEERYLPSDLLIKKNLDHHRRIAREGAAVASRKATTELLLEGVGGRAHVRSAFLKKTRERILARASDERADMMIDSVVMMMMEGSTIDTAIATIQPLREQTQIRLEAIVKTEKDILQTADLSRRSITMAIAESLGLGVKSQPAEKSSAPEMQATAKESRPIEDPIAAAIAVLAPMEKSADPMRSAISAPSLPTARETLAARKKLADDLAEATNRKLRALWSITTDAALLVDDPDRKQAHLLGIGFCEREAERRGLDLFSGHHTPEKARDRQAGLRHRDDARGERRLLARLELIREE